jgi:hypothetical protein
MYTLANDSLEVAILDPIADRERFGVRYCTGGYIYQITDAKVGELLSGPTFPDSFNWFDGQGIPDAFHLGALRDLTSTEPLALVLGIGICDLQAKEVQSFCDWEIVEGEKSIEMRTLHSYQSYTVELVRTLTLQGRTVRSATQLRNQGKSFVQMRWYPHPFYPHPETDELIKLNIPVAPMENDAYRLAENGFIARQGWPWSTGHFLALDHSALTNLIVMQKHPKLGLVAATCSYAPAFFPIWGNPRTFSWEPYLERTIGAGQEYAWWIDYEF